MKYCNGCRSQVEGERILYQGWSRPRPVCEPCHDRLTKYSQREYPEPDDPEQYLPDVEEAEPEPYGIKIDTIADPKLLAKLDCSRWVITSAQSATDVDLDFLKALQVYQKRRTCRIEIAPVIYKNHESVNEKYSDWARIDPVISEYVSGKNYRLTDNLVLMSSARIGAISANPLSGVGMLHSGAHVILAHPQVAMEMLPTDFDKISGRMLLTTGSITKPNYRGTISGNKASFHHSMAALVIDIEDGYFWPRYLHWDGKGFYDLDTYYTPDGFTVGHRAAGLVTGDLHHPDYDPEAVAATMAYVDVLKPEVVVWHDVLNFSPRSHHAGHFDLAMTTGHIVQKEVDDCLRFLDGLASCAPNSKFILASSNHVDHFDYWLSRPFSGDFPNLRFWHYANYLLLSYMTLRGRKAGALEACYAETGSGALTFLPPGKPYYVAGVDVGQHGHKGPNGARGSISAFARAASKMVIGHSHQPGIKRGIYQVGTLSLLDLSYNAGYGGWCHCNCVIYANGKRSPLFIFDGRTPRF